MRTVRNGLFRDAGYRCLQKGGRNNEVVAAAVDTCFTYNWFCGKAKAVVILVIGNRIMQILLGGDAENENQQHHQCEQFLYDVIVSQWYQNCKITNFS